jgi:hypothetical protein
MSQNKKVSTDSTTIDGKCQSFVNSFKENHGNVSLEYKADGLAKASWGNALKTYITIEVDGDNIEPHTTEWGNELHIEVTGGFERTMLLKMFKSLIREIENIEGEL